MMLNLTYWVCNMPLLWLIPQTFVFAHFLITDDFLFYFLPDIHGRILCFQTAGRAWVSSLRINSICRSRAKLTALHLHSLPLLCFNSPRRWFVCMCAARRRGWWRSWMWLMITFLPLPLILFLAQDEDGAEEAGWKVWWPLKSSNKKKNTNKHKNKNASAVWTQLWVCVTDCTRRS